MLLSKSYDIEKVLDLRFTYEDGTVSTCKLHVGDVATIVYNNAGMRDEITGKVSRIEAGTHYDIPKYNHVCQPGLVDSCDKNYWYIIVDGSVYNDSNMKKIEVKKIYSCEILKRNESITAVTSPLGDNNITDTRLVGDLFEISQDHGHTWITVARVPKSTILVDPELQPIVDKIADSIPASINPAEREKMILAILKTMEEEGQIVIGKDCECGCVPKEPEEEKPTEVPSTPMQPQLNIGAIVAAVVEELKNQGLVGGSTPETPPTTDDNTDTSE